VCDPTIWQPGFDLPRQQCSLLNCFRTKQGHCGACRRKWWLTYTDLCSCGETQTMSHIVKSCPLTKQNGGYPSYTLQMKMLLPGWPIMVKAQDTCYSATYMSQTSSILQSRTWQLIGMSQWCRSALCGHPLSTLSDNWTHGAASRHTITSPQSATLGLQPVAVASTYFLPRWG